MLDDVFDSLISRLMAGAGLIVAAAIGAVAGSMAIWAFCAPLVGRAWAHVIVAALAGGTVAIWALLQKHHRSKTRKPALDQRILDALHAHPTAAFMVGLAAGALVKGKPAKAGALWKARHDHG